MEKYVFIETAIEPLNLSSTMYQAMIRNFARWENELSTGKVKIAVEAWLRVGNHEVPAHHGFHYDIIYDHSQYDQIGDQVKQLFMEPKKAIIELCEASSFMWWKQTEGFHILLNSFEGQNVVKQDKVVAEGI